MDLAHKKAAIEAKAFAIDGIIGVSDGINAQGRPVIKILLSLPVKDIQLSADFFDDDIELMFVGQIKAQ